LFLEDVSVGSIGDEKLLDVAGSSQHLLGAGAYADVFGEILPAHDAVTVHQELCRTGDVVAVGARCRMQKAKTTDDVQIGIGEKGEREARFASQIGRDFRRVNTDGDRANTTRLEFRELLLDAS
jgi:hypothetical protein